MLDWFYWSLLSAFLAGLTAIFSKIGVEGVNTHLVTALRTSVILIITWSVAAITADLGILRSFSKRTWIFVCLSGITGALSWLCYFRAMQLGDVSRVAPIDKLSAVFAISMACLFLGEKLSWQHAVGGSLIICGAVLMAYK